jgi:uncharacterized membrane protein
MTTEQAVEQPAEAIVAPLPSHETRSFSLREQWDLIIFLLVAIIGVIAALTGAPIPLRLIFGLPLVVFVPGYALVTMLFPSSEGLDGLERIALGFGLSLALIPILALGIEFSPWKLTLEPIVGGLLTLSCLFTLSAIWRRSRLPKDVRFVAFIPRPAIPPPSTWAGTTKIAAGILVAALLLFGGSSAALVAERLRAEPNTEFAIFNQDGQAGYYPREFSAGQSQQVQLEIENHEGKDIDYSLDVVAGSTTVGSLDSIHVASGETWHRPVTIVIPPELTNKAQGQPLALAFNLYRADATTDEPPYRSLRLFINVGDQTSNP